MSREGNGKDMDQFTSFNAMTMCLMRTLDLMSPKMTGHHRRVARLSRALADELDMPVEEKRLLVIAALLHDIGAIASDDTLPLAADEPEGIEDHALLGANLLSGTPAFDEVAIIIKYHHVPWRDEARQGPRDRVVPFASHIIHLAGRVAVRLVDGDDVIREMPEIRRYVMEQRGLLFHPRVVDAFHDIGRSEALWLDLVYEPPLKSAADGLGLDDIILSLDETTALARVISRIIDYRSSFTASHSAGVAAAAMKLAELVHMSERECKMMGIAGNLHDIGKLAIPRNILEKRGELDQSEYDLIRCHPYHTYRILHDLEGFKEVSLWAALHHERLDGTGYPFRIGARDLPLGSRIMAASDVFAATAEDRPYRDGMGRDRTTSVLNEMSGCGALSPFLCNLIIDNYEAVDAARDKASREEKSAFASWERNLDS